MKWTNALKPGGRFTRSQFAFFFFIPIITIWVFYGVCFLITGAIGEDFPLIVFSLLLFAWILFIPMLYVITIAGIRRLHDLNFSGWYLLFAFIPLANLALILYLLFTPGKVVGNRWTLQL